MINWYKLLITLWIFRQMGFDIFFLPHEHRAFIQQESSVIVMTIPVGECGCCCPQRTVALHLFQGVRVDHRWWMHMYQVPRKRVQWVLPQVPHVSQATHQWHLRKCRFHPLNLIVIWKQVMVDHSIFFVHTYHQCLVLTISVSRSGHQCVVLVGCNFMNWSWKWSINFMPIKIALRAD